MAKKEYTLYELKKDRYYPILYSNSLKELQLIKQDIQNIDSKRICIIRKSKIKI